MSKKDLILSIMHGYDYPFVEPFFESLKRVNYRGEVVVFVSDKVSKATRRKLATTDAKFIDYHSAFPFIESYRESFKHISPSISINNYRFILFLQFLTTHQDEYERVMLTDIRDVIFQKEPFSAESGQGVSFFLEAPSQTFRHKFNYEWLSAATDVQTADALADEPVSCAGITIGSIKKIIAYLAYIKSKLVNREKLEWGLDQGIHNSYLYVAKPDGLRVFSSDDPYVINLGAYQPYNVDQGGQVVNSKGEPYAIVHQYDRSGKLFIAIKEKYIGGRIMQKLKRMYYLVMP